METHQPAKQAEPTALSEVETLWSSLMSKFENASQDMVASLHAHETQRTRKALDAVIRADSRRTKALNNMLHFLDSMDDIGRRPR